MSSSMRADVTASLDEGASLKRAETDWIRIHGFLDKKCEYLSMKSESKRMPSYYTLILDELCQLKQV